MMASPIFRHLLTLRKLYDKFILLQGIIKNDRLLPKNNE